MESTQSDRPKPQGQYHSAFGRLPGEIIEHILYRVDPSTFASLVVLNRRWRRVTQSVHLYAHHLSRCPSYSASNNTRSDLFKDGDLPFLRRRFESEVKRNLFEAYLQPDQTIINLVSTSTTSSSAFPAGEAFHFSFSPRGLLLLAFSSSRMFVIDIASPIVSVKREFKILRRPAAATILDDGLLLAVLSSDHQLNLYDLMNNKTQHLRSLTLDNAPRRIVLSPRGSVLAAAYEGGIEIYSVASDSTSADRRAVKCDPVDHLSFSADGTRLLGTTLQSPHPSTFILSAPYYNDGGCDVPASELLSQMWRTQILFPNSSRDCSHTTLLPQSTQDGTNWTFTYDRVFETFRAVRVDDLRNGTTYFTGPTASGQEGPLLPSTVPAASQNGELVAAAFRGKELWVYGVPEDLESVLDPVQASGADGISGSTPREVGSQNVAHATTNERYPQSPEVQTESRVPQWQILCDKSRNVFTHGRHIANVNGITDLRWVFQDEDDVKGRSGSERLVAVAPGGVDIEHDDVEHGTIPVDGGRVIVLDFSHGARRAERRSHTIEVGEQVPESLEEESRDMDMEVALARRRTVAQHHNDMSLRRQSVSRTVSSEATQPPIPSLLPPIPQEASHLLGSASSEAARRFQATVSNPEEGVSLEEVQAALDDPYSHTQPRSQTTLHRAATAAAVNLRHNPRSTATSPVAHRRAGGRSEIPDESDADNWVPPPPPYTADADVPLPAHLRWTLLQSNTEPVSNARDPPERPARASTVPEEGTPSTLRRTISSFDRVSQNFMSRRPSPRRGRNGSASHEQVRVQRSPELTRHLPTTTGTPATINQPVLAPSSSAWRRGSLPQRPASSSYDSSANPSNITNSRRTYQAPMLETPTDRQSSFSMMTSLQSQLPRLSTSVTGGHPSISSIAPSPASASSQRPVTSPSPNPSHVTRQSSPASGVQRPRNHQATPPTRPNAPEESNPPVHPSAEQLANLERRSSRPMNLTSRRSLFIGRGPRDSRGACSSIVAGQNLGRLRHSRSAENVGNRGHGPFRESRLSALSSPNIARPDLHRLDTIHSVISQRAGSLHSRSTSREMTQTPQQPFGTDRVSSMSPREPKRRVWTRKKKQAKDSVTETPDDPGGLFDGTSDEPNDPSNKVSRCSVM